MMQDTVYPVIDTHAHLEEFSDPQTVVDEARHGGVVAVVAVGQDLASNRKALDIAASNPHYVFPAVGYHPWRLDPQDHEATLADIDRHLPRCVALGEVGLDYKAKTKKKVQKAVFSELIALAGKHDKPIVLHCRYSHARAFQMVRDAGLKKVVFHWFSGPVDLIPVIAAEGYYMSASPALLYNPYHQKAISAVPMDRLLLETDSPVTYRSLKARPVHVRVTLEQVAKLKQVPCEEVASHTTQNAKACFGLEEGS
ncbi:MAG: TatD family hydrolase [Deltaproteobacteria bacterium]|nr:TatD family hydrolase [Deltaproteobacteria bacterium]